MRTHLSLVFALLCAAACSTTEAPDRSGSRSDASVTAFEGARLIAGDGSDPLEDAIIIVDGTRITRAGARGGIDVPADANRVDLRGKTVIPALIDTHTHLSRDRDALIEDLRRRAYWGVGAAMSLGQDQGELPFAIRNELIPGAARFRTAGRGITAPEQGRSDIPYWITDPELGRQAVREQAALGVDIIKIWVDDRGGKYMPLSPAVYRAVIDEAHRHDLRVTAHIFSLADAKDLLRAGVDAFAHGVRDRDVDDEFVAMMKERPHVVIVPNLPDRGVAADLSWLRDAVPDGELQTLQAAATDRPEAQQAFAIQARNLARLSREGVRIALGSDGNTPWGPHIEMADMVAAGMTPAAVLVAATRNSAAFMRLPDMGVVEGGRSADFIVLDADPLEDISNTRRISAVYLRGAAVERNAAPATRPAP